MSFAIFRDEDDQSELEEITFSVSLFSQDQIPRQKIREYILSPQSAQ